MCTVEEFSDAKDPSPTLGSCHALRHCCQPAAPLTSTHQLSKWHRCERRCSAWSEHGPPLEGGGRQGPRDRRLPRDPVAHPCMRCRQGTYWVSSPRLLTTCLDAAFESRCATPAPCSSHAARNPAGREIEDGHRHLVEPVAALRESASPPAWQSTLRLMDWRDGGV